MRLPIVLVRPMVALIPAATRRWNGVRATTPLDDHIMCIALHGDVAARHLAPWMRASMA
jgi:hypothetical protein